MNSKIGIINYGVGNIASVANALNRLSIPHSIITEPNNINKYTHIILPGVGSFKAGMQGLELGGWSNIIKKAVLKDNVKILGICLGMQLIFDVGYENGEIKGLGLIAGVVKKIKVQDERLPHLGWNDVDIKCNNLIASNLPEKPDFYFAHSYHIVPEDERVIVGYVNYGERLVSIIAKNNIYGTQFHPEKSQENGMILLENFYNT